MKLSNNPELRRLQKNAVFGILYRSGTGPADIALAERIAEAIEMRFNNMQKIRNILPLDEADKYMAKQMNMTEDAYRLWLMDILLEPPTLDKQYALGFQVSREMVEDDSMYHTEPRRLNDLMKAAGVSRSEDLIGKTVQARVDREIVGRHFDKIVVDDLLPMSEDERKMNLLSPIALVRKLQRMADGQRELGQEEAAQMFEAAIREERASPYFATDNGEDNHVSLKRSTASPRRSSAVSPGRAYAENVRRDMSGAGQPLPGAVVSAMGQTPNTPPSRDQYSENHNLINEGFDRVENARMLLDNTLKLAFAADPHSPDHLLLMRDVRAMTVDYINQCRTFLERCNFNQPRPQQPMGQGIAGANRA